MKNLNQSVLAGDMKIFTGTKTIRAVLTTKEEYCGYRGWSIPEDEDPKEEIYLVEYEPDEDSKPNHENHTGYISMSPKHVFEKHYRASDTFAERLDIEYIDLLFKINKLSIALSSNKVPTEEVDVLLLQLNAMQLYERILKTRLKKLQTV